MSNTASRAITASVLAGAALFTLAPAAIAAPAPSAVTAEDGPAVVDEPDTGDLNDKWTFAPIGVPVFGVIDSVLGIPGRLGLPALPSLPSF
ncbi:hypothetical protein [Saccharopolyspora dendranthemae]|uniref:GLTT repeat-containing protein n=1 Tax=Saccharopolyspora dendranthemae TaxID=1181886 RepID=A0A561VB50_9PSEU|nr:hypothetical protein [Saccharopolyspora dendranthemae]TWG08838.1 hypothetical protein FHU35_111464 [Saccharopolyspora dendranthemae]